MTQKSEKNFIWSFVYVERMIVWQIYATSRYKTVFNYVHRIAVCRFDRVAHGQIIFACQNQNKFFNEIHSPFNIMRKPKVRRVNRTDFGVGIQFNKQQGYFQLGKF